MPITPKIMGGQLALIGQFPHHAGILIDGTFTCGGSLISRDWVLTSAQCAEG
jgi:secreted trypsin-like serine protease